ncbi:MAG: response regulator [Candidatus Omnitrophica bacterium]|nr:response regulator [Candidatus Omnitrophota bacterium]
MSNAHVIEILLVEDNPGDINLTKEALSESKMANKLSVVKDGVEAMKFLRKEGQYSDTTSPDIVFLDLNLPKKDGREVLKELKEDAQLRVIPVVVLTSSEAEEDIIKAYLNHANCYVRKPLDFAKFLEVVRKIEDFWFSIVKLPHRDK